MTLKKFHETNKKKKIKKSSRHQFQFFIANVNVSATMLPAISVRLQHSIDFATIAAAPKTFDLRFFFCFEIVSSSGFVRCRFCGLLLWCT